MSKIENLFVISRIEWDKGPVFLFILERNLQKICLPNWGVLIMILMATNKKIVKITGYNKKFVKTMFKGLL